MLRVLNDRHPESYGVRCQAVIALGKIGPEDGVVRSLIGALNDGDQEIPLIREYAAEALARIGPEKGVVPALLKALKRQDGVPNYPGGYATYAGVALANIGPRPEILKGLVKGLRDRNKLVRRGAAASLGLLGTGARNALNPLVETTNDKQDDVVLACLIALDRVSSKETSLFPSFSRVSFWEKRMDPLVASELTALVPALTKLLHRNRWIAAHTANLLGEIGCTEATVESMLMEFLTTTQGHEVNLKAEAARALIRISWDEEVISKATHSLKETFADDPDFLIFGINENLPDSKSARVKRILRT